MKRFVLITYALGMMFTVLGIFMHSNGNKVAGYLFPVFALVMIFTGLVWRLNGHPPPKTPPCAKTEALSPAPSL